MKKGSGYSWIVWLFGTLFLFYKYAIEVSPSVMTNQLMTDFEIDGAKLGNLAACYFYSYLIMQIPAGLLIDRFGPRLITTFAIGLCALGSIVFSFTESITVACFGRFLNGIGAAFSAVNCLKLIANWFPKNKFAFMAGLMMSVGMLGAVFGQAPLSLFINAVGWRSSIQVFGYVGIVLAVLFWFIVRNHPKNASDVHIIPDKKEIIVGFKNLFKRSQPWLLSVYSGLTFAPVTVFGGLWGVPFLMQYTKLDNTSAAHVVSYIFIGFAIGAPLMGYVSDQIKSRKSIMYIGTSIATILIAYIIYFKVYPVSLLCLVLFLFGFFISSFLLSFTMIKEISSAILAATAIGFMNTFDALIGAVSDPLTGSILDMRWDGELDNGARIFSIEAYQTSLSILPIFLVISFILLFFIKETFSEENYPSCLP